MLMTSTHALGLAQVDEAHWLRSDWWLPNGWATVAFVVLSGYGCGYLFSDERNEANRSRSMPRRGIDILLVMLVSNVAFSILRKVAEHDLQALSSAAWWLGFLTLQTEWTISGVLFPTGLLLLIAPTLIRAVKHNPYGSLVGIVVCQLALAVLREHLRGHAIHDAWAVRLLLTEGLGGFPVMPFLANGSMGIWIGLAHRRSANALLPILILLICLQIMIYASTWLPDASAWRVLRNSFGAVAKFGCVYGLAIWCAKHLRTVSRPLALIGCFALGSFVMHRVFLQGLSLTLHGVAAVHLSPATEYLLLFAGTLALTWLLSKLRAANGRVNLVFRKLAL